MDNILRMSPTESRIFIWFAKYNNDEYFYEYDTQFNKFDDIKRDILKYFGLTGMNMIMKYDVSTGIFDICDRKIEFLLKDSNGNEIKLTNADTNYNDCISYKSAETIIIGRNQGSSYISGYHFGYKVKLNNINLKVIVHIPMTGKVNMDISITSDKDIEGDLYIVRNGSNEKIQPIKLVKNQTSNVNWIVV